jgi:hypothetical protein
MLVGDTGASRSCAALVLALALACRAQPPQQAQLDGPSCRDVARRAEAVIRQVADTARLDAMRFYAEVIDLCQEPGLAQRARMCLTRTNDVDTARACPSLPATGDTVQRVSSCDAVVAHALKVLVRESDVTVSPTDGVTHRPRRGGAALPS